MLRIAEHVAVYSVVAAAIWWQLYIDGEATTALLMSAVATALLVLMLANEIHSARKATEERREAEHGQKAAIEAERLRKSVYDLCAALRLGFDICESCWALHPDKATKELDRLRAAVGQFVAIELSTPASN